MSRRKCGSHVGSGLTHPKGKTDIKEGKNRRTGAEIQRKSVEKHIEQLKFVIELNSSFSISKHEPLRHYASAKVVFCTR